MHIYAISLASRSDRRRALERNFPRASIVDAIDGRTLPDDERVNTMTKGERGCFLSHIKALRMVAANPAPFSMVVEDDCDVLDMFRVAEAMREMPADCEALSLGCNYIPSSVRRVSKRLAALDSHALYGAHCIVYTRHGAQKAVQRASEEGCIMPYDLWISRVLRMYVSSPPIAFPRNVADSETQRIR